MFYVKNGASIYFKKLQSYDNEIFRINSSQYTHVKCLHCPGRNV